MPACVAMPSSTSPRSPAAMSVFMSPSSTALNGCVLVHSGCCGAKTFTRSRTKASWVYIGCSTHNVPSLSNVAMRSAGGTKSGPPCWMTRATKPVIACLLGPSFHDGSESVCACACRKMGSTGANKSDSVAVLSRLRRSMPGSTRFDFMTLFPGIDDPPALVRQAGARGPDARLLKARLLPFVRLHHLLDLLLDLGEVEGRGLLHRWVVDERLSRRRHGLLHLDEAPELAGHKVVHVAAALVVERLAADRRRALERILAQVDDRRHVGRHLLARPAPGLLVELELEVVDADGAELGLAEVEQLGPRRRSLAGDQIRLAVAVQLGLGGLTVDLHALQQLRRDVRIARRRDQRRQPIQSGEDAVLHRARLDLARPARDARHTEAALEHRALGGARRRHAAVGPSEDFGAVVGSEDHDGVVGAEIGS